MAINPHNFEKSDRMKWSSDSQGSGQVRCYTCVFCKRGFSNAQALGGHMNIHRMDRVKLKQAADENSLPLDITLNPADHEPQASEEKILFQRESSERKFHQLPLFVEGPSARDDIMASDCARGNEEKGIRAPQQTAKVNLELRLGREPQETSTVSTREFF